MLFNQTNQFKKQEFQTVKKESIDRMAGTFLYAPAKKKEVLPVAKKEQPTANRNYKDTVFRMLFSDRKNLLSLYNAVMVLIMMIRKNWKSSHWKMPFIWE